MFISNNHPSFHLWWKVNFCCVTVFLTWYMIYQSPRPSNNYYVAVILCLIKSFVLKVHLNILINNIWLGLSLAKTGSKPFRCQPHRVIRHIQTICRLLLKICLSLYDLFVGLTLKGLRASILTNSGIFCIAVMLFPLEPMLLFIEIFITLLFLDFKLFFLSVLCFIFKSLVLLHYFKVIKEFTFLIYLSMPIDNLTWQARVFHSSKPLFKKKKRYASIFTPSCHTLFIFILDFHFNSAS